MKNKVKITLFFGLFLSTFYCSFAQQSKTSLDNMIEKKKTYNQNIKNGYSVILYSGEEEKAKEIYYQFKSEFEDLEIQLTYTSPDWKVTTIAYTSKIEAERTLLIIKDKFPNAKLL